MSPYLLAMRPRTLPAAATPVLVGCAIACAAGGFRALPALACLVGALLLQVAANFANDVFDYEKGADGPERLGPTRAVAAGLVSASGMRRATAIVVGLCVAVGAYLVAAGGWPILALGIAAILAALAYTGGPWPLGYHGLGELFVFLFFGLAAVVGTAYVQLGQIDARALACAAPVGALATAIIVVNNLRDRVNDARVGKRTLAVRLGRRGSLVEYAALLAIAYVGCAAHRRVAASPRLPLLLLTAPRAIATASVSARTDGAALNPLLGATARLLAIFGLLLSAGWLVGR